MLVIGLQFYSPKLRYLLDRWPWMLPGPIGETQRNCFYSVDIQVCSSYFVKKNKGVRLLYWYRIGTSSNFFFDLYPVLCPLFRTLTSSNQPHKRRWKISFFSYLRWIVFNAHPSGQADERCIYKTIFVTLSEMGIVFVGKASVLIVINIWYTF